MKTYILLSLALPFFGLQAQDKQTIEDLIQVPEETSMKYQKMTVEQLIQKLALHPVHQEQTQASSPLKGEIKPLSASESLHKQKLKKDYESLTKALLTKKDPLTLFLEQRLIHKNIPIGELSLYPVIAEDLDVAWQINIARKVIQHPSAQGEHWNISQERCLAMLAQSSADESPVLNRLIEEKRYLGRPENIPLWKKYLRGKAVNPKDIILKQEPEATKPSKKERYATMSVEELVQEARSCVPDGEARYQLIVDELLKRPEAFKAYVKSRVNHEYKPENERMRNIFMQELSFYPTLTAQFGVGFQVAITKKVLLHPLAKGGYWDMAGIQQRLLKIVAQSPKNEEAVLENLIKDKRYTGKKEEVENWKAYLRGDGYTPEEIKLNEKPKERTQKNAPVPTSVSPNSSSNLSPFLYILGGLLFLAGIYTFIKRSS